jgi:hypothetical protein
MDGAAMVYPWNSFLGRDVWDFERPCTHHPVLGLLPAEGNRRWFAIVRVYSGYNMQLGRMSVITSPPGAMIE